MRDQGRKENQKDLSFTCQGGRSLTLAPTWTTQWMPDQLENVCGLVISKRSDTSPVALPGMPKWHPMPSVLVETRLALPTTKEECCLILVLRSTVRSSLFEPVSVCRLARRFRPPHRPCVDVPCWVGSIYPCLRVFEGLGWSSSRSDTWQKASSLTSYRFFDHISHATYEFII